MKWRKRSKKKCKIKGLKDWSKSNPSSSLEDRVMNILLGLHISHLKEYPLLSRRGTRKYYDFFVFEDPWCLLIECHGSFWHCADYWFHGKSLDKLYSIQRKNLRNDKLKNKIAKEAMIPILYIWEHELHEAPQKIKKTIDFLRSGGRDLEVIGEGYYGQQRTLRRGKGWGKLLPIQESPQDADEDL